MNDAEVRIVVCPQCGGPSRYEAAKPEALVWALERASRSGRVAYQFARDYAGKHA